MHFLICTKGYHILIVSQKVEFIDLIFFLEKRT